MTRRTRIKIEFDNQYRVDDGIIRFEPSSCDKVLMVKYANNGTHIVDIKKAEIKTIAKWADELYGLLIKF